MIKYITSVIMGILIAILLIVLLPIISLIVLIAGFLGLIKINEENQN